MVTPGTYIQPIFDGCVLFYDLLQDFLFSYSTKAVNSSDMRCVTEGKVFFLFWLYFKEIFPESVDDIERLSAQLEARASCADTVDRYWKAVWLM